MKILMIGGTGIISLDIAELSVRLGHEVFLFNRGTHLAPEGTHSLHGDISRAGVLREKTQGLSFDVVADFISFTPDQLVRKLEALRGRYEQYIFLSSCGVYDRGYGSIGAGLSAISSSGGLISEQRTPTANFGWDYARNKIACEHELIKETWLHGGAFTVVRPAETYNRRRVPGTFVCDGKWYTQIDRMRRGKKTIVHDDGLARVPLTHAEDFARAFVCLYGNPRAYGEAFHIVTHELISWQAAAEIIAEEVGVAANICHIPWQKLVRAMPHSSLGDTYGMLACAKHFDCCGYDCTKLRSIIPDFSCKISFREGIRRTIQYYDEHPAERLIDTSWDEAMDRLVEMAFMES